MMDSSRVLIVDDEKPISTLLAQTFEQEGHEVANAFDGIDCMNKMATFRPDVVIMDIMMPKMNGIELSKEIFNINEEQIIIVISAHSDSSYLLDLINLGINHFIQKPLDLNSAIKVFLTTSNTIYSKNLIQEYNQKNALSQKTIDENKGHLVLFTREKLEKM